MDKQTNKQHVFLYKMLFTIITLLVYMIGRRIPLVGIDLSAYREEQLNAQMVFLQSLSGDFNNYSIFILGIWPYMLSSMLMFVYMAIKQTDKTSKVSPKKVARLTMILTIVIAAFQAYNKVNAYIYNVPDSQLIIAKVVVFIEMMTGMMIVIRLCNRNQKYGLGGRMVIILVNIVDGLFKMLVNESAKDLLIPALIGIVGIMVMIVLETTEKRIAVQRVSIHNIYAEKNYIAYKLNPGGIMPVMFASAAFMLPQVLVDFLCVVFPDSSRLADISEQMNMTHVLGIIVYLFMIALLEILFALLMIDPKKTSEGLMKAGDSILDVYAGKDTTRYLVGCVLRFAIYSSIVLAICLGTPLFLSIYGVIPSSIAMLPTSIMMSTGIWIAFYREAVVYRNIDHYKSIV